MLNYFVFAGKILNPFTVLQFPNADCIGEDNLIGTCYTSGGKNKVSKDRLETNVPL